MRFELHLKGFFVVRIEHAGVVRVLLLAAGASERFGSDKRSALLYKDQTLLRESLDSFLRIGCEVTVCLAGDARDDRLADELAAAHVMILRCHRAASGMGDTLSEAVGACTNENADVDVLLIALADMPLIASSTITSVIDRSGPDSIVLPVHAGRRGHPVAFGKRFFPDLMMLSGDRGAAAVINRNCGAVIEIPVADPGVHADADTRDALAGLRSRIGQTAPE